VLEHAGVAITPGVDFGTHRAEAHVRFAYTIARERIEDGIARLARYLGKPVP
jgi:aspartate/methionine/tyrosine aminotransferase